jgi:hypothetical protein
MTKPSNTCPLCLNEAELVRSHIIPEAAYRHLFDEKRRLLRVSVSDDREMEKKLLQTGSWERLLCKPCDVKRLGPFETYFARVWFEHPKLPARLAGERTLITGLDYARFKLAHLASLFRAHHAKRGEWSHVDLGMDAERIRQLLLAGDPGPDDFYPLHCTALRNPDGSAANRDLVPFFTEKRDGQQRIHALYGGCHWMFEAGGTTTPENHLRRDGSLLVAHADWKDSQIIRGIAKRIAKEKALMGTELRPRRGAPSPG